MSVNDGLTVFNNTSDRRIIFGFIDPNSESPHPGWPLRNYLALLAHECAKAEKHLVEVLALRDRYRAGERTVASSLVLTVELGASSAAASDVSTKQLKVCLKKCIILRHGQYKKASSSLYLC